MFFSEQKHDDRDGPAPVKAPMCVVRKYNRNKFRFHRRQWCSVKSTGSQLDIFSKTFYTFSWSSNVLLSFIWDWFFFFFFFSSEFFTQKRTFSYKKIKDLWSSRQTRVETGSNIFKAMRVSRAAVRADSQTNSFLLGAKSKVDWAVRKQQQRADGSRRRARPLQEVWFKVSLSLVPV